MEKNDPVGQAILAYAKNQKPKDILVCSDLCDDDIIPVEVLFRGIEEMPELEKKAMTLCRGSVLDVGAGAGIHAGYLCALPTTLLPHWLVLQPMRFVCFQTCKSKTQRL